jgi:hypothetical protein
VIERQLAHVEGNAARRAYNHAQYLSERVVMMQWWADYIDKKTKKNQPSKKIDSAIGRVAAYLKSINPYRLSI